MSESIGSSRRGEAAFPELEAIFNRLADHPRIGFLFRSVGGLALLCAAGYLAVAIGVGMARGLPQPVVHDEFSYLLAGQTYAAGHLTLPAPEFPEFFETYHEITSPVRASKYPSAQGLFLALGIWLGHPLYGVWLSGAMFVAAMVWALAAAFSRPWAFVGGVVTISLFGGGGYWTQSYWGGMVAALGGALVLGGFLRWITRPAAVPALALGAGAALLLHSRPFEGALYCLVPAWHILADGLWRRRSVISYVGIAAGLLLLAGLAQLVINREVTGQFLRMPYSLYEQRYNSAPVFVWQTARAIPDDIPLRMLQFDETIAVPAAQLSVPVWREWASRVASMATFFWGIPFGLVVFGACAFPMDREQKLGWAMLLTCWASVLVTYWQYPHYQAPATAAVVLIAVGAVRQLAQPRFVWSPRVGCTVLLALHVIWMSVAPDFGAPVEDLSRGMQRRESVIRDLLARDGNHLVFVDYDDSVTPHVEWVFNDAELDRSRIIWARDLGKANDRLTARFDDRSVWRVSVAPGQAALAPIKSAGNVP